MQVLHGDLEPLAIQHNITAPLHLEQAKCFEHMHVCAVCCWWQVTAKGQGLGGSVANCAEVLEGGGISFWSRWAPLYVSSHQWLVMMCDSDGDVTTWKVMSSMTIYLCPYSWKSLCIPCNCPHFLYVVCIRKPCSQTWLLWKKQQPGTEPYPAVVTSDPRSKRGCCANAVYGWHLNWSLGSYMQTAVKGSLFGWAPYTAESYRTRIYCCVRLHKTPLLGCQKQQLYCTQYYTRLLIKHCKVVMWLELWASCPSLSVLMRHILACCVDETSGQHQFESAVQSNSWTYSLYMQWCKAMQNSQHLVVWDRPV